MMTKLSIVSTLYRSASHIAEFCERSRKVAESIVGHDFEIVLVNDGSPDDSCEVAIAACKQHDMLVIVDLARNFGHHKAMMTGLLHAKGERVFLIDCDLEEPPEVLPDWWDTLDSQPGLDVVYGVQAARKGDWFEKFSGNCFYWLINRISPVPIPPNSVTARLMTRRYVDALTQHLDREVFMLGLWSITGFRQQGAIVSKGHRGTSSYTIGKRLALFANAITSFSVFPLYLIFYSGTVLALIGFGYITQVIITRLLNPRLIMPGWTSLVASVWLIGGANLMAVGVLGIYLAKVFSESKRRPYTIVRSIYLANRRKEARDGI